MPEEAPVPLPPLSSFPDIFASEWEGIKARRAFEHDPARAEMRKAEVALALQRLQEADPATRFDVIRKLAEQRREKERSSFAPLYIERLTEIPSLFLNPLIVKTLLPEAEDIYAKPSGIGRQLLLATADIPGLLLPGGAPSTAMKLLTRVLPRGATVLGRLASVAAREGILGAIYGGTEKAMLGEEPTLKSVAKAAAKTGALWATLGAAGSGAWMVGRKLWPGARPAVALEPWFKGKRPTHDELLRYAESGPEANEFVRTLTERKEMQEALYAVEREAIREAEKARVRADAVAPQGGEEAAIAEKQAEDLAKAAIAAVKRSRGIVEPLSTASRAVDVTGATVAEAEIETQEILNVFGRRVYANAVRVAAKQTTPETAFLAVMDGGVTPESISQATVRFVELVNNVTKMDTALPRLQLLDYAMALRNPVNTNLAPTMSGEIRRLIVKQKLSEFGQGGPLTSEELETLHGAIEAFRERVPVETLSRSELLVEGAAVRERTAPKWLGAQPISGTEEKLEKFLSDIIHPRSEGASLHAETVTSVRPPLTEGERAAAHAKIDSWRKVADEAFQGDPVYADIIAKETEALRRLAEEPGEAALAGEVLAPSGLGAQQEFSKRQLDIASYALAGHKLRGVESPLLVAILQDAIKKGYVPPKRLQDILKDVLNPNITTKVSAEDVFSIMERMPDGSARCSRVSGEELIAKQKAGVIIRREPTERATSILTAAGVEKMASAVGMMPELAAWPAHAARWAAQKLTRFAFQSARYFEIWRAPGMVEAVYKLDTYVSRGRSAFNEDVARLETAYYGLNKAEREAFSKALYAQEASDAASLGVFSPTGVGGKVDNVGRLFTNLNKRSYEQLAEIKLEALSISKLPHAKQVAMRAQAAKEVAENQYIVMHTWKPGRYTFQVRSAEDIRKVIYRLNLKGKKEIPAFLDFVEKNYGSVVARDAEGKIIIERWDPFDYIQHYADVPDYDTMLKAVNQVGGAMSGEVRESLLRQAARHSGRFELMRRRDVAGFTTNPDDLVASLLNRIEHQIHRHAIEQAKESLFYAVENAPKAVQGYAREWRTAVMTSVPDNLYGMRTALYTMVLGANLRFCQQQLLQNMTYASAHFLATRPGITVAQIGAGIKFGLQYQLAVTKNLPAGIREVVARLEKDGVLEAGALAERGIRGFEQIPKSHGTVGRPLYWIGHIMRWTGNKLEQVNRRNAAIKSAYQSMQEKLPFEETVTRATNDVYSIHSLYSKANRPLWLLKMGSLQPLGAIFYMFQSFPVHALAQFLKVAGFSGVKVGAGQRATAIAVQALSLGLVSGALGYPGVKTASWIYRKFNPESDPEGAIRTGLTDIANHSLKMLGASPEDARKAAAFGADLVLYGAPGTAGIDATTMLGLSNLPNPELMEYFGVLQSTSSKVLRAYELAKRGEYERATEVGLPIAQASKLMKAARWLREGVATDSNNIPILNEDGTLFKPNKWAVTAVAGGLTTLVESRYYQKQAVRAAFSEAVKRKQSNLYRDVTLAYFRGDSERVKGLVEGALRFNAEIDRRMQAGEDMSADVKLHLNKNTILDGLQILRTGQTAAVQRTKARQRFTAAQQQQR